MNVIEDSQPTSEYVESDLGTAAFLVAKGFSLLGLRDIGGRYGFRFSDENGRAERAAIAYLQGEAVVARELIGAEKTLKALLYRAKDRDKNWGGNSNGRDYRKSA